MEQLTKLEETIMLILWDIKKGFIKDILEKFSHPVPHYNTVSTIIKILQEKGFVDYKAYGKSYQYYPLIEKETYLKNTLKPVLKNYFSNSPKLLFSFFVKENKVSIKELEELIKELKK